MRIIIQDVLTVTMNEKREIDTFSILIEDGVIASLSKRSFSKKPGDLVIPGHHRIALPGLINGHIHSDISLARGLGDGLTLYEQDFDSLVSRKRWFSAELNREARYYSRLLQYIEAVKGGTTFICDVPFWWCDDDLVLPFRTIGISGAVVLDYRKNFLTGKPAGEKQYFKTAADLRDNGYIPIVEAPAEEDFEESLLLRLDRWAREMDTSIQLHLAETMWRLEIIKKKFQTTPVKYLQDIGFMSERVIGSHGVYLDEEDRAIISDSGARIINCPVAEMKISDGIAPVSQLLNESVPVGLGTDGALWNDSSDMFSEMKTLMLVQRVAHGASSLSAYDALYAATMGGARAFNLDHELGSIEEGKRAHIILIDYFMPHLLPIYNGKMSNVLQIVTSCVRASDVDTVIVDGNIIVEKGKLKTINEESILQSSQELAHKRFRSIL